MPFLSSSPLSLQAQRQEEDEKMARDKEERAVRKRQKKEEKIKKRQHHRSNNSSQGGRQGKWQSGGRGGKEGRGVKGGRGEGSLVNEFSSGKRETWILPGMSCVDRGVPGEAERSHDSHTLDTALNTPLQECLPRTVVRIGIVQPSTLYTRMLSALIQFFLHICYYLSTSTCLNPVWG